MNSYQTAERGIEAQLVEKLTAMKYTHRHDIRDRDALEQNFRAKFEALNRVHLTDAEFSRLLDEIISPDVFACSERLRNLNTFEREDGTPLHYQLVNLKDWCKNEFEVVNQLRLNTRSSFQRYDVILLVNGLPLVQIELKAHHVSPRRAMQQILEYKKEPGNNIAELRNGSALFTGDAGQGSSTAGLPRLQTERSLDSSARVRNHSPRISQS
jgi:type I restriction enzyme R subunit